MKKLNLKGQKFGRLTVISEAPNRGRLTRWFCLCSCGRVFAVDSQSLTSGHTKSCGCLMRDIAKEKHTTHGLSDTRIFRIWAAIIKRCTNKNDKAFKYYGGRGISVCPEWKNDFKSFFDWANSNGYRENLSIDRINSNGDYCPENCRWADRKIQSQNRQYVKKFQGKPLTEWCNELKINPDTVRGRLRRGWSFENALFTPTHRRKK